MKNFAPVWDETRLHEARDKADFSKYRRNQEQGPADMADMIQKPEVIELVKECIMLMNRNGRGLRPQRQQKDQEEVKQAQHIDAGVEIVGLKGSAIPHPDPYINAYNAQGFSMLPGVKEHNPNLRNFVGNFIFPFVLKLVGLVNAGYVTGMLLNMPIENMRAYLCDFRVLHTETLMADSRLEAYYAQR